MANVLGGKLRYLKMVRGEDDALYQKLKQEFDTLTNAENQAKAEKHPAQTTS